MTYWYGYVMDEVGPVFHQSKHVKALKIQRTLCRKRAKLTRRDVKVIDAKGAYSEMNY